MKGVGFSDLRVLAVTLLDKTDHFKGNCIDNRQFHLSFLSII